MKILTKTTSGIRVISLNKLIDLLEKKPSYGNTKAFSINEGATWITGQEVVDFAAEKKPEIKEVFEEFLQGKADYKPLDSQVAENKIGKANTFRKTTSSQLVKSIAIWWMPYKVLLILFLWIPAAVYVCWSKTARNFPNFLGHNSSKIAFESMEESSLFKLIFFLMFIGGCITIVFGINALVNLFEGRGFKNQPKTSQKDLSVVEKDQDCKEITQQPKERNGKDTTGNRYPSYFSYIFAPFIKLSISTIAFLSCLFYFESNSNRSPVIEVSIGIFCAVLFLVVAYFLIRIPSIIYDGFWSRCSNCGRHFGSVDSTNITAKTQRMESKIIEEAINDLNGNKIGTVKRTIVIPVEYSSIEYHISCPKCNQNWVKNKIQRTEL